MYLLFLTIKLFLCFYLLLFQDMSFAISRAFPRKYPFYDLMIFMKKLELNPKEKILNFNENF